MRVCVPGRMDAMARRHVFVDVRAAMFPVVLWLCLVYSHTLKGCTATPGCGGAGPVLKPRVRGPQGRVDSGPKVECVCRCRVEACVDSSEHVSDNYRI